MIPPVRAAYRPPSSKPRASGDDPDIYVNRCYVERVNPARAGMIREQISRNSSHWCKPRASGDDPLSDFLVGFSLQ